MRNTRKRLAAAALALGLALGGSVAVAAPASAGTTIPATYNGGTGISYVYYASTDDFCIDPSSNVTFGYVDFARASTPGSIVNTMGPISTREGWACRDLKQIGFREGERVRFTLRSSTDTAPPYAWKRSSGYLTV